MRRLVVGALLGCALTVTLTASALPLSSRRTDAVTAIDARTGHVLPHDPVLHRGQQIVLTVRGFAARAPVRIALVRVQFYGAVRADRRGRVLFRFTVPRTLRIGRHVLIFSGLPAGRQRQPAKRHPASRTRDPQVLVVTVPFDPPWPFRLGGSPHHRPTSPPPAHGSGGAQGGHAGTSFTGIDVAALVLVALALVAAGVGASCAARRRR